MKRDVGFYLCQLLYRHNCLVLPSFGGLVGNRISASVHPVEHHFQPPFKKLVFNKNLRENDGLLAAHVSRMESVSYEQALEEVKNYVDSLHKELESKGSCTIKGIGKFRIDAEKNLVFFQDTRINYLPESFALPSFRSNPILRFEKQETRQETAIAASSEKNSSNRKWAKVAALVTGALALFQLMVFDIDPPGPSLNSLFNFPSLSDATISTVSVPPIIHQSAFQPTILSHSTARPIAEITQEDWAVPTAPVQVAPARGYFAIFGSFKTEKAAQKLLQQLAFQGLDAQIRENENGDKRVCVYLAAIKSESFSLLETYRQSHGEGVWMLRL